MPDITIDAATVQKVLAMGEDGEEVYAKFADAFLQSLEKEGIRHVPEGLGQPHFLVNGKKVEYFFQDNGTLDLHGENANEVEAAIRKFTKPAEHSVPPPKRSFVDKFRGRVEDTRNAKGGRKTRAKKEPKKRKTRKAKKSTRRR
jgi:hypothetical protein